MVKRLVTVFALLSLLSCQQEQRHFEKAKEETIWKKIQVGGYYLDFPADFKLVEEQGIDSYVGRVEGNDFSLFFDFGYHSDDLGKTPEEYLKDSTWLIEAGYQFMKPDSGYVYETMPKPKVLSIRQATTDDSCSAKGCDYIAECQYQNVKFLHPIFLPEEMEKVNIQIDTVDYQYRRIATSKTVGVGTAGMYIRDLSGFDADMNDYLALVIVTDSLTKYQQTLALKIFSTAKRVR